MKPNRIYISILVLILAACSAYSQIINEEDTTLQLTYDQVIDTFFREIAMDTSKIPTGILIDRAPDFIQRETMDGNHPEYIIGRDSVLELYNELYYGHFNFKTLLNVEILEDTIEVWKKQNQNIIPLMLVHSDYHKIKADAFTNGWLTVDSLNMLIHDVTPSGQTAFEQKTAFGVSPLVNSIPSFSATFMLPSQFVFSNTTYDELLIDAGDGQGFRPLDINQPISLSFPASSNAVITIQAIKGNDTLTSRSNISLPSSANLLSANIEVPDIFHLNVNNKIHDYGIWWSCDNAAKCIKKPIIIVEGYDPTNRRFLDVPDNEGTPGDCLDKNNNTFDANLYCVANEQGMADKLRNTAYDVVILNFNDGLDRLEDQAEVVKALIRELKNKITACGSNNEFVILGPSAGGLTARYALADMEGNGEDHNTRLFISFDAPHQGANLPLSDQHEILFLKNTFPISLLTGIKTLKKIFFATATKQMLVYHAQETKNKKANPAPEFNTFFTKINGLNNGNGYPVKCRNIAISDGSGLSGNQGFNPGDKLFAINKIFGLFNIVTDGWAVPSQTEPQTKEKIFSGLAFFCIPCCFPFCIPIPFPCGVMCIPTNISLVKVDNTDPYDNAPGGQGSFTRLLVDNIGGKYSDCKVAPCDMQREDFIPTISSLDLKNTTNLFYHVKNNITGTDGIAFKGIDYSSSVSPFDAIFVSATNQPHVIGGLTQEIANFICDEIMPEHLFLQNRTVTDATDFEALKTVTAGYNVTNRYPQGDFIVENTGHVNIRGGESVTLKPGTHLKPKHGGSIRVYANPFPPVCTGQCRMAYNNNHASSSSSSNQMLPPADVVLQEVKGSEKNILVHCFPNPFTDHAHIDYSIKETGYVNISVYNSSGIKISDLINNNNHSTGNFTTTFDAHSLPAGMYAISIQINDKREVLKIIKSK